MDFSYLRQNKFTVNDYKKLFEKYEHNPPSLQEALNQMFKSSNIDDKNIELYTNEIMDKCKKCIDPRMNKINTKFNTITKDDAYIICSYTVDIKDRNYSPYRLLNQYLTSNENEIIKISKYLYILLKSLRKLPRYYPDKKYLYRCIGKHVPITEDPFNKELVPYVIGNKKTFYGFISTHPDPKTTYNFLARVDRQRSGTIFSFGGDVWGYDIELFNFYNEPEILLEPGVSFIVENVLPSLNGIIYITCKVINIGENIIFQDKSLIKNEEKPISEEEIKKSKENLDKNNENYLTEVKKLRVEKENLQSELSKAQKIIKNLANNQIDNNELKNLKVENENLKNQLVNKDKEIKDLKSNIIERPKYDINDIMVINFVSLDSTVHYGIKCVSTDVFAEVEEKLYKIYDDLRNTNNMFTVNAKPVLRSKKLCENNIKDGDVVQLIKLE